MKRLVVFVAVAMLADAAPTWAQGTLVDSAMRAAQNLARTAPRPVRATQTPQQAPGLETASGLSKRTKIMIAIGAAAGFAAVAYSIDRNVVDSTPSTLGTRKD